MLYLAESDIKFFILAIILCPVCSSCLSSVHLPLSSLLCSVFENNIPIRSVWRNTHSCLGKSAASGSAEGRLKSSWQQAPLSSLSLRFPPSSLSPTFISHFLACPPPDHCPMDASYHLSSALAPPSAPPSFPSPPFFIISPPLYNLPSLLYSFLPSCSYLLCLSPSSFCRVPVFYRPNDYSALHMSKEGAESAVLLLASICLFLLSISFPFGPI